MVGGGSQHLKETVSSLLPSAPSEKGCSHPEVLRQGCVAKSPVRFVKMHMPGAALLRSVNQRVRAGA